MLSTRVRARVAVQLSTALFLSACSQDWSAPSSAGQDAGEDAAFEPAQPADAGMDASSVATVNGITFALVDGAVVAFVDGKPVPALIDGLPVTLVDGSVVVLSDGEVVSAVVDGSVLPVVDGAISETPPDAATQASCSGVQCQHGGSCSVVNGAAVCACTAGWVGGPAVWSGARCELDVDECQGAHGCPAGNRCENLPGGYTCAGELADFPLPKGNVTRAASDFVVDVPNNTALDTLTGLRWQRTYGAMRVSFSEAQQACANLTTLGHRDWRLPSYLELLTFIGGTSIRDRGLSNIFSYEDVWTSTPMPGLAEPAYLWDWHTELKNEASAFVRCVRRELPICTLPPQARFKQQSNMVLDQCTKLTWEQVVSAGLYANATSASVYCGALTLGGRTWRVPTYTELLSTFDLPRRALLTVATAAVYDSKPDTCFMSSTPVSQLEATPPAQRPFASMLVNGDVWRDGPPQDGCLVRCVSE